MAGFAKTAGGDVDRRTLSTLGLAVAAWVVTASVGPPARADDPPPPLEPSVAAFLDQTEIEVDERSVGYEPPEVTTAGCGAVDGIDGDPSEWTGEATGINGTSRHHDGELIWTDYPYDDAGTGGLRYPGDGEAFVYERGAIEEAFDHHTRQGRPTERLNRYGGSAADVVDVRFAVDDTHLRIATTFSFLNAIDSTVVGYGFDLDGPESGFAEWPLGARLETPGLDLFVTAHGAGDAFCATLADAAGDRALVEAGGAAVVDLEHNVMEVAIPLTVLGESAELRAVGGSGVWDVAAGTWMAPEMFGGNTNSTGRVTGAATADDPAVFNLLFRDDEPLIDLNDPFDTGSSNSVKRVFQTQNQQTTLAGGTSGPYGIDLDLDRLRTGGDDPLPVRRGDDIAFTRTYRSRIDLEGLQFVGQQVVYLGRYQPYGVYLPECYETGCDDRWPGDEGKAPLIMDFHGGDGSHVNELSEAAGLFQAEKADEAVGALFVAPLGRGRRQPWWRGMGEADVLEVLDDVRDGYAIDHERVIATGASLGGYATLRMSATHPDLWAGAGAHCPAAYENSTSDRAAGNEVAATQTFVIDPIVGNLTDVPLVQVSGTADPLVRIASGHRIRDAALAADLNFRYTEYFNSSHCFLAPGITGGWMDNHIVEVADMIRAGRKADPARVRLAVDPRHWLSGTEEIGVFDTRDLGLRNDTAYWVSAVTPRAELTNADLGVFLGGNAPNGPTDEVVGRIDVASHALPGWGMASESCGDGVGFAGLYGGNDQAEPDISGNTGLPYYNPHAFRCQDQLRSGAAGGNQLDLVVSSLSAATIDLAGAGLDGGGLVTVMARGDGELRLTLSEAGAVEGDCVTGEPEVIGSATVIDLLLDDTPCEISFSPS